MTKADWAPGVVARYVTRAAEVLREPELTVDVSEAASGGASHCRGCGSTPTRGTLRATKIAAEAHAHSCRALPGSQGVTS